MREHESPAPSPRRDGSCHVGTLEDTKRALREMEIGSV
jgi:hypothetical protein